jgi:hypothetical protein
MPVLKAKIGGSWIPVGAAASLPTLPVQSAAFTPTWSALVVGTAGINVGRYVFVGGPNVGDVGQLNLTVYVKFGSAGQTFPNNPTLNIASIGFNLWPSDDTVGSFGDPVGGCRIADASPVATYLGHMRAATLTGLRPVVYNASGTYTTETTLTTAIPMTWAVDDQMICNASMMVKRV